MLNLISLKKEFSLKEFFLSKRRYFLVFTVPLFLLVIFVRNFFSSKHYSYKFEKIINKRKSSLEKRHEVKREPNFYLINDPMLIKLLLARSRNQNNLYLESQLIQPYLIFDSKLRFKMSQLEYEKFHCEFFTNRFVRNTKSYLIESIIKFELKQFESKLKSKLTIQEKDICILIFNCVTSYLIYLFKNEEKSKLKINRKNYKKIFKCLIQMNKLFDLNLFVNNFKSNANQTLSQQDQIQLNEYGKFFSLFIRLIEKEFQLDVIDRKKNQIDPNSSNSNLNTIKFMCIKNTYLDFIKICSCVLQFLNDSSNINKSLLEEVRNADNQVRKLDNLNALTKSYLCKATNLDLYLVSSDFMESIPSSDMSENKKVYCFPKNSFIALNIGSSITTNQQEIFYSEGSNLQDPNNLIIIISQAIILSLIKTMFSKNEEILNFQLKKNKNLDLNNVFHFYRFDNNLKFKNKKKFIKNFCYFFIVSTKN